MFHDIGLGGGQSLVYNQIPFVPGSTYNATPTAHPLTAPTIEKIAGLMLLGGDILQGGGLNAANTHYGTSGTAADWSAAVQLAIWDTEYSPNYGPLNWSGGSTTPETRTIYTDLVGAPVWLTGTADELLAVDGQQSFATPDPVPTPEPSSMAMLAFGLLAAGFALYRRNGSGSDITA
jgi:hypothetical protein